MARKDLSRTVIEGGRYHRNCWERRASHGLERATTRAWLDTVAVDLEEAEASSPPPIKHVYKEFRDKLGPAMRWLRSQVGRPWSKVYSELRTRFDSRTVAGRHVVEDHILKSVHVHGLTSFPHHRRGAFFVDEHGILRTPPLHGRNYHRLRAEVDAWCAGRVCALTYRGWWWFRFDPRASNWIADAAMTRGQIRTLERLEPWLRVWVVIASPWPAR